MPEPDRGVDATEHVLPSALRTVRREEVRLSVGGELLRLLPSDFVTQYEALFLRAFAASNGSRSDVGVVGAKRITRVSTNQVETRGGAKSKRAGSSEKNIIHDQRALGFKAKVDRKLRKLSRDIRQWMEAENMTHTSVRRCTRCRKYADDTWSFCPFDGAPTEEVD